MQFAFRKNVGWLIVACLCSWAGGQERNPTPSRHKAKVVGYLTEDGIESGRYTVKDVATRGAAKTLTQIDYAFGRIAHERCEIMNRKAALERSYSAAESVSGHADPEGPNQLRGAFHQLQELKRLHPHLRVLISFGGWGQSQGFSSAADPSHVREFVRSCVHTFIEGDFAPGIHAPGVFDGIDIDWEYPVHGGVHEGRPEDSRNFTLMAAEFRRQLDAVRPGLLLTAALPAEPELYAQFELKEISAYMDELAIMAYDMHWNSEPVTNLHSALFHDPADPSQGAQAGYSGDAAVQAFAQAGVPKEKIILGVPFYGKGWSGVGPANHGLYQPAGGKAHGGEAYRDLKALPASADRQYYQGPVTCSVWSGGNFWSYDCPQAMRAKRDYVDEHHLGGVMFWELSHDTPDGELLRVLAGGP
jgi:chitinase